MEDVVKIDGPFRLDIYRIGGKMQIGTEDLRPFLYLRNLLNDLLEHPQKYNVSAEELAELHAAASTINQLLHRVKRIGT
jgi:hypothetical protein